MAELLLEILSEEIPARMQVRAADDLKRLVCDGLKDAGLAFDDARAYVTPRRLCLVVDGLAEQQPDVSEERKGPPIGAPEKAMAGFLKANGLTLDQCEKREIKGKEFYFVVIEQKGRPTRDVLSDIMPQAIAKLPWPKSMRWGANDTRWVRPLHAIACLFAGSVVDFSFAGKTSGNTTRGHRFMAPDPITVTDFADYQAKLRSAFVVLDHGERAEIITQDATRLAEAEGLTLQDDPALLAEVAGLVEWPEALIGGIDDEFMAVPAEVLTSSMRTHQKYFSLENADGTLAPRFITIANMRTDDGGKMVAAGNERVLRARLSDARFFWDQDRKQKLESRTAGLSGVTFHVKLGSVGDKVDRMESLAAELCEYIPDADRNAATRAAHLAKADLVTGMVGEFPDLQGLIGRYYALHDGEDKNIAEAIAGHYSPQGPGDACPTEPITMAVALADKIDSLVGFFAIDEKPTGSRDPFALRRAALGVIRIITENNLRISLSEIIPAALSGYGSKMALDESELLTFFADRLKVQMRGLGVRHDLIEAVFATPKQEGGMEDDLVRLLARVDALAKFLDTDDGANILIAYKRAANIVAIEEKKDKNTYEGTIDESLLVDGPEKDLNKILDLEEKALAMALSFEDFTAAMGALAHLRAAVDKFFDDVTVNDDDAKLRANRLNLLARIRAAVNQVADFSKIEG